MSFKRAVRAEPHPVKGACRAGKQALENRHRELVTCKDPRRLTGSIDLDSALAGQPRYANDARWDYGLGYRPAAQRREQAVWIEVHSATTGEVDAVLGKPRCLQDWLHAGAGCLKRMTDRADSKIRFVWIASAGVNIPQNSPKARLLRKNGIQGPMKWLSLR